MESFQLDGIHYDLPESADQHAIPEEIGAEMVAAIEETQKPLRHWPEAIANFYRIDRKPTFYREMRFLLLMGFAVCLATSLVDFIAKPGMVAEGLVKRIIFVAPFSLLGVYAVHRRWDTMISLCTGAAALAFVAVIVHLAFKLPLEMAIRYLIGPILLVGLANIVLPFSMRELIIFDISILLVIAISLAFNAPEGIVGRETSLVVCAIVGCATLPVAARMERLRQGNFLLGLRAQITNRDLLKANRKLQVLSETDPLTGIANRRCFERKLHREVLARSGEQSDGATVGLLLVDIDHFKAFNDEYGHQAGDFCLKRTAKLFRKTMESQGGIAARYGGEEFIGAICLDSEQQIVALAQELRCAVSSMVASPDSTCSIRVTVSVGIGIAKASSQPAPEELLRLADAALYSSKKNGRNRVEIASANSAPSKSVSPAAFL